MPQSAALSLLCLMALGWLASAQTSDAAQASEAANDMRASRFEDAIHIYKNLCLKFPGEAPLHLSLATALHATGKDSEALQELRGIQASEKQNAKFWFLLGETEAKLGEAEKAIEPLTKAVELDPDNFEARLEAASTLMEARQYAAAERQYRLLSAKLPKSPKVWQGLTLSESSLSQQALADLKKAAPRSSYLFGLAALAAAESEDQEHAIELYRKAISSSPQLAWLKPELAALESGASSALCSDSSYACRVSLGESEAVAKETVQRHDPESLYWTTRLNAQFARQSLQKLDALPPSPEQHEVMARLYLQNGRRTEAIAELQEALQLSPDNPLATADLAEALWADRQYDKALVILSSLTSAVPTRADWQFELGDTLFNLGRSEEALTHLNQAVKLSPALLPAQAKLGETLLRMGDAAGAVPHLERAESLDRDGSIHFQLASAYRKLGNTEAAAKAVARQKELANGPKGMPAKLVSTQ